MTRVQSVDNTRRKPILTPAKTGIAAATGIAYTTARAFTKSKTLNKTHKIAGIITAALTVLHIGTAAFYHHKYKKM